MGMECGQKWYMTFLGLSQKSSHVMFHVLLFSWSLAGSERLLRDRGSTKQKEYGSLNHCVEGSSLDIGLKFTRVRNKLLLYYTTEISVCQLQRLVLPLTTHNVFLILLLYFHVFNFLLSILVLCVWKRRVISRNKFIMPCWPDFWSFTWNKLHMKFSIWDQDKYQSYGNVKYYCLWKPIVMFLCFCEFYLHP